MIWLYERGAEVLRIETRFDATASHFELIWHRPDGTTQVEKFSTEAALKTEHWNQAGAPRILREGWKEGNNE